MSHFSHDLYLLGLLFAIYVLGIAIGWVSGRSYERKRRRARAQMLHG